MIKAKEGKVEVKGFTDELLADVGVIIHSLVDAFVENDIPRDEAVEEIRRAVELGFKTEEEIREDAKKKLGEFLKKMYEDIVELFEEEEEQADE